ncbi:MAG: urea ABC transporter permease subunit UrtB [Desulfomonilaceae bacterium]
MFLMNQIYKHIIVIALCLLGGFNSYASKTSLRQALINLEDPDKNVREQSYKILKEENDATIIPVLEAFNLGLLENRDGQLVIYGPQVEVEKNRKKYPLLDAFTNKQLLDPNGNPAYTEHFSSSILRPSRAERIVVSDLIKVLSLSHYDIEKRIAAIVSAGDRADASTLPILKKQLQNNPEKRVSDALRQSLALIKITHGLKLERLEAVRFLGKLGSARAILPIRHSLADDNSGDPEFIQAAQDALNKIDRYQKLIGFVQEIFSGLSLGSILVLMALGLAVIFGLMGVINMAQGEFMMLGAFTTYVVSEIFKRSLPPDIFNYYFLFAVPAAFIISALAGLLCEWALIRHLYGCPLETLLATWGLSLVLIQSVRVLFGDTLSLTPPDWLNGSWEVSTDLVFPINRMFIIIFCGLCTLLFFIIVQKTRLGLLLRSTVQDRETASSLGVPTRKIDGLTFALGTGLAGLAGCVIPLYDKINPGMGQGYVVDSFMVVVLGGLGKLAGVIIGGIGLGFMTKFIEPFFQAVYGKALVLGMVIVFLQWRPAGLFPSKGRLGDE